jgi:apolipoprotein N-acyltransferase
MPPVRRWTSSCLTWIDPQEAFMSRVPALVWCLLSSLLLWLSFFPFDLGALGWVALIPLLLVLERYLGPAPATRPRWYDRPLLSAWLGGLVFCLVAFQWIRIASPPMYATWIVLALAVSVLQWPLFFVCTRLMTQHLQAPLILAAPVAWTALEFARSQIYIGFAWYFLGHTQHHEVYFTQAARLVGVYGLSFVMVMVNVGLWRTVSQGSLKVASFEFVPAVVLVGLACWYGSSVLEHDRSRLDQRMTKKIAILQGNQEQDLRNTHETWVQVDRNYSKLGDEAAQHQPALIVAPETCLSLPWIRLKEERLPDRATPKLVAAAQECRDWARKHAQRWKADILLGWNTWDFTREPFRHTNSAILLDRTGRERGSYAKIVCLPFGEYIPLINVLPFLKWLSPYDHEYAIVPGTEVNTLEWDYHRIAVLICYEDTVPDLVREFMRTTSPDFLANLSNDGWFKGWEEHEQHLVCARFRCIETHRSMVRAVNMGVSCIIDGLGRIIQLPPGATTWHEAKNREAVIVGTVPLYDDETIYTRYGDLLPWGCWLVIAGSLLVGLARRARGPHAAAAA